MTTTMSTTASSSADRQPVWVPATTPAARTVDAVKIYGKGDAAVHALDRVTVEFASGTFSAIMGPSGSGKSTLLHAIAGLDELTSGHVFIGSTDLTELGDKALTTLRRDRVGFVFQAFNDPVSASYAERVVVLADGRIVDEIARPTPDAVLERMKRIGQPLEQSARQDGR